MDFSILNSFEPLRLHSAFTAQSAKQYLEELRTDKVQVGLVKIGRVRYKNLKVQPLCDFIPIMSSNEEGHLLLYNTNSNSQFYHQVMLGYMRENGVYDFFHINNPAVTLDVAMQSLNDMLVDYCNMPTNTKARYNASPIARLFYLQI